MIILSIFELHTAKNLFPLRFMCKVWLLVEVHNVSLDLLEFFVESQLKGQDICLAFISKTESACKILLTNASSHFPIVNQLQSFRTDYIGSFLGSCLPISKLFSAKFAYLTVKHVLNFGAIS